MYEDTLNSSFEAVYLTEAIQQELNLDTLKMFSKGI